MKQTEKLIAFVKPGHVPCGYVHNHTGEHKHLHQQQSILA